MSREPPLTKHATSPPAVKSKLYHLQDMSPQRATVLAQRLGELRGVREAVVLPDEKLAILKVDMRDWDEALALQLIGE